MNAIEEARRELSAKCCSTTSSVFQIGPVRLSSCEASWWRTELYPEIQRRGLPGVTAAHSLRLGVAQRETERPSRRSVDREVVARRHSLPQLQMRRPSISSTPMQPAARVLISAGQLVVCVKEAVLAEHLLAA